MGRTIDLLEVRKMKKNNGWSAEMMTALGGLYDFEVNLMNFNIPDETEQRMLFDFTQLAVQQSQYNDAYNFDTISYALMCYLEENGMDNLIECMFPTSKDKLYQKVEMGFIKDSVNIYNDLINNYGEEE